MRFLRLPRVVWTTAVVVGVLVALALDLAGAGLRADRVAATNPTVIQLISGSDGTGNPQAVCSPDPLVTYTTSAEPTPQNALVGAGHQNNVCHSPPKLDLFGSPVSQSITRGPASQGVTNTTYTTTFMLPTGFGNPDLELDLHVDDVGKVFLNGNFVADVCHNDGSPVDHISVTNASLFQAGTNTLTFQVLNNYTSCSFTEGGFGGDDQLNLEFEGTVTFKPQPPPPLGGTAAYPDLSSGTSAGVFAGIAAAAATVALGGAAWYARRRLK